MSSDTDSVLGRIITETTDYEFKVSLEETKPKSWLKSVCGFANGIGGMLAFGVNDDGIAIGLDDAHQTADKISELIGARIDPCPNFHLSAERVDGVVVLLLDVPAGRDCPYFYVGDGTQVAYVRAGSRSLPANASQLRTLSMRGAHVHFDELETQYKREDYSFDILKATYLQRTGDPFEESDFISFGLATRDGALTNAGVLLADQPILRCNRIFCTRWNGLDKTRLDDEVSDDHEYSGCLLRLLREGTNFVERNNVVSWAKTDNDRVETPSYVARAVEEALVNALIHRDYGIGGAEITVFAYDDRLEITSPGGKVDGPLPQNADLEHVDSVRRNPVIADLFQRMRFMERKGSGLKLIRDKTAVAPNYEERFMPRFEDDGRSFRVILWNMNHSTPQVAPQVAPQATPQATPQVAQLVEVLGDDELSLAELMDRFGLTDRKYFRKAYLKPALDSEAIEMTIPTKPTSSNQRYRRTRK
ncbi:MULTISPECIES: ATP-binding protein [Gordonibacter]|uniref:ATP-binding protein n=1 Tax=Gordonibacter faecis TaxID=3047475 RepID=A0ABT7DN74_9ACTN|nr:MULTISPECIES: ATP-binding protein [unclassified Gordonibacter]MDJ1650013.1 ATP-binding protein [Gordonibacter sp. KGMB12511]HIW76667.1 putative DNA binding domain-containing protein [Candidatus Gordonibacter avicola]